MKVLIIRLSAIGDIVLTSPVVRCLKQQVPNAEIHFLCKAQNKFLLEGNPHITKVLTWDVKDAAQTRELLTLLQLEAYDWVLDLQHNLRTRSLSNKLKGHHPTLQVRRFHKLNIEKWLYVNLKWDRMPAIHVVDRYMATAKDLGVQNDGLGLEYHFPTAFEPMPLPAGLVANQFIAVVLGATYFTKQLPVIKAIELVDKLTATFQLPVVIIGGPQDEDRAKLVADGCSAQSKALLFNTAGTMSFHQSAWVVSQAGVVISNDTGLMHVAAAFKRPTVALWGNTTPKLGMYPYNTLHLNWQHEPGLGCRPCSKIGFQKCPKGHFRCMNDLNFPVEDLAPWLVKR